MEKTEIGRQGEEYAARYLARIGYRIVGNNYRAKRGEIDLVAVDGEELVFVEVRFRSSIEFGTPAETVDWRKRRRLIGAARDYLARAGRIDAPCRFDVIGLTAAGEGAVEVEHHKNAFDADGRPTGP